MSTTKTAKLVAVRPEARLGTVELGSDLLPFNVNVVVRKKLGRPIKFSTATQIVDYVAKHRIRDVQVEIDDSNHRVLSVLLP